MVLRKGRFGPFLSCSDYPACKGIVKIDRKGGVALPKSPPLTTDLACSKCQSPLNLRSSKRGPWLSCSAYPKCKGKGAWKSLDEKQQKALEIALANHEKANPAAIIHKVDGSEVPEGYKPLTAGASSSTDEADGSVEE
jgi:DNA topoisomerase-1